jgi:hypothetical protein
MNDFDALGLYAAMEEKRTHLELSWQRAADEIWSLSHELNQRRGDHPVSPSTLTGIAERGDTSCQHALFFLRWLGRTPESFLAVPPAIEKQTPLPSAGPDERLRWNLSAVYEALDAQRRERALTWKELARTLHCSDNQLRGIRIARYAIGMKLMMRIVQWLEQPAAAFIYATQW